MSRSMPPQLVLISYETESPDSPPLDIGFTTFFRIMAVFIIIYCLLYLFYQWSHRGIYNLNEISVPVSRENHAELGSSLQHQGPNNHVCRTATSISSDMINSVPSCTFGSVAEECAVCLSSFETKDAVRQLPLCRHVFHVSCIDKWLTAKDTCPLCRSIVNLTSIDVLV